MNDKQFTNAELYKLEKLGWAATYVFFAVAGAFLLYCGYLKFN